MMATQDRSLDASRPPMQAPSDDVDEAVPEPVWRYVDDAVSMSFSMEYREASVTSSTDAVIRDLMEIRYGLAPTLKGELRVNRGTLGPLDFRAQCAAVRRVIEQPDNRAGLNGVQRSAILARFAYQQKRAVGVQGLFEHFASLCNSQNPSAVKALIWGTYDVKTKTLTPMAVRQRRRAMTPTEKEAATRARGDWSLRAIEREYGVSKSVLGRDKKVLSKLLHETESHALLVLDAYFRGIGLVGDFE